MSATTQIFLFGSLRGRWGEGRSRSAAIDLESPSPLREILHLIEIPPHEVQLAMVNHRAVPRDHIVHPGDRVSLFPREYAIFADWKDFRR